MSVSLSSGFCCYCDAQVRLERPNPNHVLHLLLTILTGGLWVIIWIGTSIQFGGWRCSRCGRKVGF